MYKLLIVDNEHYIRLGIRNAIDWSSINVEIIGEAADGLSALEAAREAHPDIILLDICMPLLNGIEVMKQLRKEGLDCDIIVLSGYDEFEYAQQCIQYGVQNYLLKPVYKQDLKDIVEKVCLTRHNRKNLQNYQNLMEAEHFSLCSQFLQDLLLGNLDDIEIINKKREALQIPLLDGFYQTMCIKLDDYDLLKNKLSSEEFRLLKETLRKLLDEQFSFGTDFRGIFSNLAPGEWGVLLSFTQNPSEELWEKQLRKYVDLFLSKFEEISTYTISISISSITDSMTDLHTLHQNTRHLNRKFIPGQNSVIWPNNPAATLQRSEIHGILNFVSNHYNEPIMIQQVADALYMSPSYLMHLFKKCTGKTFNTYLMEYRMEKAKELLLKPGIQIQAVAQAVGYSDVKYFNKLFKKYTTLTPSDYIKINYAKF